MNIQILKLDRESWSKFKQVSEKVPTARTSKLLAFDTSAFECSIKLQSFMCIQKQNYQKWIIHGKLTVLTFAIFFDSSTSSSTRSIYLVTTIIQYRSKFLDVEQILGHNSGILTGCGFTCTGEALALRNVLPEGLLQRDSCTDAHHNAG